MRSQTAAPGFGLGLVVSICLLVAGLSGTPSPSAGLLPIMTGEEGKAMFKRGVELSQHIVIGKVVSSESYECSPRICTWYTIEVVQSIKGGSYPGDVLAFYQTGGTFGNRIVVVEDQDPLKEGRSYLLYLSACPEDITSKPYSLLTGRIQGDSVTTIYSHVPTATAVLVDSIRGLCRVADIEKGARSSALVIEGVVTRCGAREETDASECAAIVEKVVTQHAGPPVDEGGALPFELPAVRGADAPIQGTRPVLHEGSSYLLFLNRTGTEWSLRPTVYAAWRKDGSVGVVRGRPPQCPASAEMNISSAPWDTLLARARE